MEPSQKLEQFLKSHDVATIEQGVELALLAGDEAFFRRIFTDVSLRDKDGFADDSSREERREKFDAQQIQKAKHWSFSPAIEGHDGLLRLLRLLDAAPAEMPEVKKLRKRIRGLCLHFATTATDFSLTSLAQFPGLQRLSLSAKHPGYGNSPAEAPELEELSLLKGLSRLRALELRFVRVTKGSSLASLPTSVREMELHECVLEDFALPARMKLESIKFSGVTGATLEEISLGGATKAEFGFGCELPALRQCKGMKRLKELGTRFGGETLDFLHDGLAKGAPLENLYCWHPGELRDISALAHAGALRVLRLPNALQLKDVSALSGCTELRELYLHRCEGLEHIDGLAGLAQLEILDLNRCKSLTHLPSLEQMTSLRMLDLRRCEALASLEPLASLPNIRVIALEGTPFSASDVPPSIRWATTWAKEPIMDVLSSRPMAPEAARQTATGA